jgi:protein-tyrosine-phosphatase
MKVLFICRANVGRSQAALELYRLTGGEGNSAGTKVDNPNTKISDIPLAANIIQVMRSDYGIDMSSNIRTQLDEEVAKPFDRLIVMAEADNIPEWLLRDTRTIFWDIKDPKLMDIEGTRKIVKEIESKIADLKQF